MNSPMRDDDDMLGAVPVSRWPVPAGVEHVVLMGGTFDPVHRGHVELALAARGAMERGGGAGEGAWLVFVPAARNPLKDAGPRLTDRQRIELLALALRGAPRVGVSTIELEDADEAAPVSYTVDTLRKLSAMNSRAKFRLVIGADSARSFHRWRDPAGIIALAEPMVLLRRPDESPEALLSALAPHWSPGELDRWRSWIVPAPLIDVSSTWVRELVERGEWEHPELVAALHPNVLDWFGRSNNKPGG
ncbi:MAG: nicotinate-nicotinamide nucleotide adenylyltransferase [Phycisphaerales bacterium]